MLKLYGFARVNKGARGNTRDLCVLAYRARCTERLAWKKTLEAYRERVEAA